MATKPEVKNPDVKIHVGTGYGGARQPPSSRRKLPTLSERAKKFKNTSGGQQELSAVRTAILGVRQRPEEDTATDGLSIRWEKKSGKNYVTVNRPQLLLTLRKRMCNPLLGSGHLYSVLLNSLQDPKLGTFVRFHITAVGVDQKSLAVFIKLKWENTEFILPQTFLQDCNVAFLNQKLR